MTAYQAGRGRLDSSANLKISKPPRSLILSTGEETPRGHSVRARLWIIELSPGSINKDLLAKCQSDADHGLYARSMGAFIGWTARRYEELQERILNEAPELRRAASSCKGHMRTPDIMASLQLGVSIFLEFAEEVGAINSDERGNLEAKCWRALANTAVQQAKHQATAEPTQRFLQVLRA